MKNLIRHLLLFVFAVSVSGQTYPDWFLHPGRYGSRVVTGYSINGNDPVVDAERTWAAFHECIVVGKLELYSDPQKNLYLRNSDYFYNFSPDSLAAIRGKLIPLDAFVISVFSNDIVVLFGKDSLNDISGFVWIDPDTMAVPEWTERSFWQDDGYYYGVGTYTSRGNPNDAWRTAEERAIFSILTNKAVTVHRIRQYEMDEQRGDELTSITALRLRFRLRNIEVLERWPDKENRVYYVLVRIPVKGLFSPDLK